MDSSSELEILEERIVKMWGTFPVATRLLSNLTKTREASPHWMAAVCVNFFFGVGWDAAPAPVEDDTFVIDSTQMMPITGIWGLILITSSFSFAGARLRWSVFGVLSVNGRNIAKRARIFLPKNTAAGVLLFAV